MQAVPTGQSVFLLYEISVIGIIGVIGIITLITLITLIALITPITPKPKSPLTKKLEAAPNGATSFCLHDAERHYFLSGDSPHAGVSTLIYRLPIG